MSSVKDLPRTQPRVSPDAAEDLVLFHRTLAEMCRAGVPLPKSLRLLSHDLSRVPLREATLKMASEVEQGMSLAQAYQGQSKHLPSLYQALVEAGIASGDLPAVLDEISRHASQRAQIAHRLRRALFYPLVSAIGTIAIGVALLCILGPQLEPTVASRQVVGSAVAPGRIADSYWGFMPWILLAVLVVTVLGSILFVWLRNPLDGGVGPRGVRYRIPLLGVLQTYAAKAGFASTMGMLIGRELPLPRALTLAAAATDDVDVARQVDAMRERAEIGDSLSESVRAGDLISPAMLWFIEAGEGVGSVATSLDDVARVYQSRLERGVDRLCFMIAPIGLLATGAIVLAFAMVYLAPIFDHYRLLFFM